MDWSQAMTPSAVPVRRAASLIVLRDGDRGIEVLMLRRPERASDQYGGAFVFPGGGLADTDAHVHPLCLGVDDAAASARLGLASGGLDYLVAAVRECFEEAGLLYAGEGDELIDLDRVDAAELAQQREALHRGELDFADYLGRRGLRLAAQRLHYFGHWLTPPGLRRRFDTRFFVAAAPPAQTARADSQEAEALFWFRAAEALDAASGLRLLPVTRQALKTLQRFERTGEVIAFAQAQTEIPMMMPRMGRGAQGLQVVLPGEWAYAEIARLDPEGRGHVATELTPGRAVRLSERVLRVTAGNGSMMTGPGTNSYFVGAGPDWALIDPGPDDEAHVQALLAAAPGPLKWIIVTHTHKDHSPAAQAIRAATGAQLLGRTAAHPMWQDESFVPDRVLEHGERLALGPDAALRVIHTPGHASNHLCFLLEQEKLLFTGDHLMQGSTVVINPPDGDMVAYLRSLELLLGEDVEHLAPGHGFLIDRPHQVVRQVIAHRLGREAKVVQALASLVEAMVIEALVPLVYADVPARLHAMAARSLHAHLLKLQAEGRAHEQGGRWRATA